MVKAQPLWSQRHFFLHDPDLLPAIGRDCFHYDYWQRRDAVTGHAFGRGTTFFLHHQGHDWVLRHYRRGGLVGKLINDSYLYLGLEKTRPVAEFKLLQYMVELGLPVPRPVAAHISRHGLWYRGDIIIERIPSARDLVAWLGEGPLGADDYKAVGRLIRRFHGAGIYHADLNSHNILRNEQGQLWLIDFDRGQRRPAGVWKEDNLARLKRSFEKEKGRLAHFHWQPDDWQALMAGYQGGA
ncbi:3-deoxy-D-manno-octulosonic acid kinase [Gallaecimonas sp. GXIMD4217]|uniref:3-deoxy-D-manno-octulosonic acid kinase n=1 Tax=Gallaecimonas sp. GXIMD4217 TaxID=3131927 RepID=UPI00311B2022